MTAPTTELLTLDDAVEAVMNKTRTFDLRVVKEPIIPASHYFGTTPDNEIRWSTL